MKFFERVINIVRTEGVYGVCQRIHERILPISWRVKKFLNYPYIKSAYGLTFSANYSDATFKFYIFSTYGRFYWDRLHAIDREFIFLDIGANQGLYAIGVTKNPKLVKSYAFEPVKKTFELLKKNIRLNGAEQKCIAINKAVADRGGVAQIATLQDHSGVATLANVNQAAMTNAITQQIELIDAVDLEEIVRHDGLPIVVKIDVEGFEPVVLSQLTKANFASLIQEIYLEVDERWVDPRMLEKNLREVGFVKFTKVGSGKSHYDMLAERQTPAA